MNKRDPGPRCKKNIWGRRVEKGEIDPRRGGKRGNRKPTTRSKESEKRR
jgi:hypothetical protein